MSRIRRSLPFFFALLLALFVHATPCAAALSRYIQVTSTSTGPGICSITIESFGLGPQISSATSFMTNVPIPGASSPANSATLIRNALDTDLPADYAVIVSPGTPNVVQINRTTGTFTMSIVESVPTQTIAEITVRAPFLGAPSAALLAILMLTAGTWWLGAARRRAPARG